MFRSQRNLPVVMPSKTKNKIKSLQWQASQKAFGWLRKSTNYSQSLNLQVAALSGCGSIPQRLKGIPKRWILLCSFTVVFCCF